MNVSLSVSYSVSLSTLSLLTLYNPPHSECNLLSLSECASVFWKLVALTFKGSYLHHSWGPIRLCAMSYLILLKTHYTRPAHTVEFCKIIWSADSSIMHECNIKALIKQMWWLLHCITYLLLHPEINGCWKELTWALISSHSSSTESFSYISSCLIIMRKVSPCVMLTTCLCTRTDIFFCEYNCNCWCTFTALMICWWYTAGPKILHFQVIIGNMQCFYWIVVKGIGLGSINQCLFKNIAGIQTSVAAKEKLFPRGNWVCFFQRYQTV